MSLLAALAKGIGAGTVNNAKAGFDEQQRQREAAQRKEEMVAEYDRRDAILLEQIKAGKEDTETRIAAAATEGDKDRALKQAQFEKQWAAAIAETNANANAKARAAQASNIIGTLEQISKRKSDILSDDKLTDEQRAIAARENDMVFYTMVSDPGAQQLLGEFGYGGYIQHGLSLAPVNSKQEPPANAATHNPGGPPSRNGAESGEQGVTAPSHAKPWRGGLIGSIQQKAAPGSFWDGREAERALYEKFKGAAPAAAMTHDAHSPTAAEAYKQMYK
ncbi:hypothetical protein ACTG25_03320 [Aeromonas sp. 80P]